MKRIIFLLVVLLCGFHSIGMARVSSTTSDGFTQISSNYSIKYQVENSPVPHECYLFFSATMNRIFNILVYDESRDFMISAAPSDEKNSDTGIVFSRKDVPVIKVEKNGKETDIILKRVQGVGSDMIMFKVNRDALKDVYDADKVSIVFPTKNSSVKRTIEVPKEAVNEWKEVFYADMEKVRKDLIH